MIDVTDREPVRTNSVMRLLMLGLLAFSCTHDHTVLVGAGSTTVNKEVITSPNLDVLFVIDNSASTADKQTVFAENFPAFVAAFDQFPGGRPNLHIGVVDSTVDQGSAVPGCPSPNMFDDGRLQNTVRLASTNFGSGSAEDELCSPPTGLFIEDVANPDGTRSTNYSGTLEHALACIAPVGANGCGLEGQLQSIVRALNGQNPENAGFLRPDADLAIVILTDEDDCSIVDPALLATPPTSDFVCQPLVAYDCDQPIVDSPGSATYTNCHPHPGGYLLDIDATYQALAKIKDPSQVSVSLVAGDPESTIMTGALSLNEGVQDPALLPSCSATINNDFAIGRPGIRLKAFADHYAPRSSFATVCQSDYTQALIAAEGTMSSMMTTPCLDGAVDENDTDPTNPGVQPACTVVDQLNFGTPSESDLALPACPMIGATLPDPNGPRPCWWAATDESCTPVGSELAMHIERNTPPPAGTVVSESCAKGH